MSKHAGIIEELYTKALSAQRTLNNPNITREEAISEVCFAEEQSGTTLVNWAEYINDRLAFVLAETARNPEESGKNGDIGLAVSTIIDLLEIFRLNQERAINLDTTDTAYSLPKFNEEFKKLKTFENLKFLKYHPSLVVQLLSYAVGAQNKELALAIVTAIKNAEDKKLKTFENLKFLKYHPSLAVQLFSYAVGAQNKDLVLAIVRATKNAEDKKDEINPIHSAMMLVKIDGGPQFVLRCVRAYDYMQKDPSEYFIEQGDKVYYQHAGKVLYKHYVEGIAAHFDRKLHLIRTVAAAVEKEDTMMQKQSKMLAEVLNNSKAAKDGDKTFNISYSLVNNQGEKIDSSQPQSSAQNNNNNNNTAESNALKEQALKIWGYLSQGVFHVGTALQDGLAAGAKQAAQAIATPNTPLYNATNNADIVKILHDAAIEDGKLSVEKRGHVQGLIQELQSTLQNGKEEYNITNHTRFLAISVEDNQNSQRIVGDNLAIAELFIMLHDQGVKYIHNKSANIKIDLKLNDISKDGKGDFSEVLKLFEYQFKRASLIARQREAVAAGLLKIALFENNLDFAIEISKKVGNNIVFKAKDHAEAQKIEQNMQRLKDSLGANDVIECKILYNGNRGLQTTEFSVCGNKRGVERQRFVSPAQSDVAQDSASVKAFNFLNLYGPNFKAIPKVIKRQVGGVFAATAVYAGRGAAWIENQAARFVLEGVQAARAVMSHAGPLLNAQAKEARQILDEYAKGKLAAVAQSASAGDSTTGASITASTTDSSAPQQQSMPVNNGQTTTSPFQGTPPKNQDEGDVTLPTTGSAGNAVKSSSSESSEEEEVVQPGQAQDADSTRGAPAPDVGSNKIEIVDNADHNSRRMKASMKVAIGVTTVATVAAAAAFTLHFTGALATTALAASTVALSGLVIPIAIVIAASLAAIAVVSGLAVGIMAASGTGYESSAPTM